ncbi:MAG: hypothetical protein LBD53_01240 [Tannerella sp.]|jgi:uncharacterized coiled-coil protein SlyX|nr:hypothetical protein [Tannerella sp.]
MIEKDINLLAVFEENINEIVALNEKTQRRVKELEKTLTEKENTIKNLNLTVKELSAKYTNLLAAKQLSAHADGIADVRKQVIKLVREVDSCIALINR